MDVSRGIIIIATGNIEYGRYAVNLAASIKCNSDIPIAVFTDGAAAVAVNERARLFDTISQAPSMEPLRLKLMLDELSPFDHTVFLDADTVIIPGKSLDPLFHDSELQIGVRDSFPLSERFGFDGTSRMQWLPDFDVTTIECMSEDPTFYNLSSEVISFRKGELSSAIFEESLWWYDNPPKGYKRFGKSVPDELPLQMAVLRNDVKMQSPWLPSYWYRTGGRHMTPADLMSSDYVVYSLGGSQVDPSQRAIYENWTHNYCKKLGLAFAWKPENKNSFDEFRKKR